MELRQAHFKPLSPLTGAPEEWVKVGPGVALGIVVTNLLYSKMSRGRTRGATIRRAAGLALIAVVFILATQSLFNDTMLSSSFALFGCLSGAVLYFILDGANGSGRQIQTGAAVALLAWSVSVSLGRNSPALGSGLLLTFLVGLSHPQLSLIGPHWRRVVLLGATCLAITAFHHTRTHHIYRERPASELTMSVGDVLPGGRLIRTNRNTHEFLLDLNSAIDRVVAHGMRYAVIPAIAGHWVKSEQENPLPIDWAQGTELNSPGLLERVTSSIQDQRSQQMVIVQKVQAASLPSGFVELEGATGYYGTVDYVRTNLERVGETQYFEIFK